MLKRHSVIELWRYSVFVLFSDEIADPFDFCFGFNRVNPNNLWG